MFFPKGENRLIKQGIIKQAKHDISLVVPSSSSFLWFDGGTGTPDR